MYKKYLGFKALGKESNKKTVFLSPSHTISNSVNNGKDEQVLAALTEIENKNVSQAVSKKRKADLYHFAILMPEK